MSLGEDERPLSQPFWDIQTLDEARAVDDVLKRRFTGTYSILESSLEAADPLDVVYPGNPNEYSDVVREILVLLADVNGDLRKLSTERLTAVVREGLARRFGEEPDEDRLRHAVELIVAVKKEKSVD